MKTTTHLHTLFPFGQHYGPASASATKRGAEADTPNPEMEAWSPRAWDHRSVEKCGSLGAASLLGLPASGAEVKGGREPGQAWRWGEPGSPRRRPGSPAPADTRRTSEGTFLPSIAKCLRGGRALADEPGRQHLKLLLAPGRAQGWGWGCLFSHPLARREPQASLTSWLNIRPGFQMLGLPRPA